MAPTISSLPAELLDRIFSSLSANRSVIGSCRLVCQQFRECSSPYLITRAIYALRLKTLQNLDELIAHPYFSKHVTELFYDASAYDWELASNWNSYVRACEAAPRVLDDGSASRIREENEKALDTLYTGLRTEHLPSYHGLEYFGNEDNFAPERRLRLERSEWVREERNMNDISEIPMLGDGGGEIHYDSAYSHGCHESFNDYRQMYHAQRYIGPGGCCSLPNAALQHALSNLPKLKTVVLGDWRGLARPGESYNSCARRLFGRTLAPNFIGNERSHRTYSMAPLLHELRKAAKDKIESLAIGPHPFEEPFTNEMRDPNEPRNAQFISVDAFHGGSLIHDFAALPALRRLRLPVYFDTHPSQNSLDHNVLTKALNVASKLTHLSLHMELAGTPSLDDPYWASAAAWLPFRFCFADLKLPHLRSLDLRGWIMMQTDLKVLLVGHASSLRQLRLLKCYVDREPSELARWAGQHLYLAGIELEKDENLHGCLPISPLSSTIGLDPGPDTVWSVEPRKLLTWEHEDLWLNGRKNSIVCEHKRECLEHSSEEPWYLRAIPG